MKKVIKSFRANANIVLCLWLQNFIEICYGFESCSIKLLMVVLNYLP